VRRMSRVLRMIGVGLLAWLGTFVMVNVVILLAGVAARWSGKDPRLHSTDWPGITHLRRVDEKLLVGGQTTIKEYAELADHGVTLVIDVRGGSGGDHDDPEALAEVGLAYRSLVIPDGRAPTPDQIRRFLDEVDSAEGLVFAHCGGGVGRATSLAAAYEASLGQDPSPLEQVATGPPSLEQIWYVATMRPGHPEHSISPAVAVVSRLVDAPRTLYGWLS